MYNGDLHRSLGKLHRREVLLVSILLGFIGERAWLERLICLGQDALFLSGGNVLCVKLENRGSGFTVSE